LEDVQNSRAYKFFKIVCDESTGIDQPHMILWKKPMAVLMAVLMIVPMTVLMTMLMTVLMAVLMTVLMTRLC
jgi:hypothetical protein